MRNIYAISPYQPETGVVYCIHHKSTGMKYIGQTTQSLAMRMADHYCRDHLDWFTQDNKNDYIVAEIERVPVAQLLEREDYWIKRLGDYNEKYRGYHNNRDMNGSNNANSSVWQVTFSDGREEIHHSMIALYERGYNKSGLSDLSKGKRKYHKDIVKVCKIA